MAAVQECGSGGIIRPLREAWPTKETTFMGADFAVVDASRSRSPVQIRGQMRQRTLLRR